MFRLVLASQQHLGMRPSGVDHGLKLGEQEPAQINGRPQDHRAVGRLGRQHRGHRRALQLRARARSGTGELQALRLVVLVMRLDQFLASGQAAWMPSRETC